MAATQFGRRRVPRFARASALPDIATLRRIEADIRARNARGPQPRGPLLILACIFVSLVFAAALPAAFYPDLQRDTQLRATFQPDLRVKFDRGACTRYWFLVTRCAVSFSWLEAGARKTADTSFLVSLVSMGGIKIVPMRSSVEPTLVIPGTALDYLGNRTWTLAVLSSIGASLGVLFLTGLYRSQSLAYRSARALAARTNPGSSPPAG